MKDKASEIHQEGVLRRQDHAYGTNVPRGMPKQKKIQEEQDENEDTDSEYQLSSTHSESASSELPSDDQSPASESEACRKSHKVKSHKKKGKKTKERVLRQEVVANRMTVASAGTLARKRKNKNLNGDLEIDVNASKHHTGSHSTPETSSDLVVGEFDVDKAEEIVAAAREHKSTKVKGTKTSGPVSAIYHTTAGVGFLTSKSSHYIETLDIQMGLKINRKAHADDAMKEEVRAVKMLKPQKPLRKLKLKDLPLQDKSDHDVWNRLVCAVIDWAGSTTTDPFGMNEHPDLSAKLQELWEVFFHHNTVDINEHPAIKKIATDRLNEWHSTFGKDALKILEHQFKHPEFRHDVDTHIKFVCNYLPRKVNNQKCVPFIYADIENFKGAWLAPVLLELVATHVKHCGKAFGAFRKPIRALGLAAAAYHHALSLYTEGESAKEAAKEAKRHSDTGGDSKHAKNIDFDAAWGSVAMHFAEQAAGLPERKWEAIENALSELVGMDARSDDEGFDNDNNIMDIRGVVLLSDSDTEDRDPQLEQADS
ncbi:hypothetical protein F4604DRAFT_1925620 [Suillus subluteus]|nr:hypothetical protein F4604DRAFT_1925620 [Suillus subluteus]